MIDSNGTGCFAMPDVHVRGDTVRTGGCVCSPTGLHIRLPGVTGDLRYDGRTPLRSDIMGPFAHLPMQCRHGVVSMGHTVHGRVTVDGQTHVFGGGSGYAEKDSGRSFPKSYLWLQCNDFTPPCALMLSIAHIPFLGGAFTGSMTETIRESCDAHVHLRLTQAGRTILVCESDRATCERRI